MMARKLLAGPEPDDIIPGDWVRVVGHHGAGLVESVTGDVALITRLPHKREIQPLSVLRRVKHRGDNLDRRDG